MMATDTIVSWSVPIMLEHCSYRCCCSKTFVALVQQQTVLCSSSGQFFTPGHPLHLPTGCAGDIVVYVQNLASLDADTILARPWRSSGPDFPSICKRDACRHSWQGAMSSLNTVVTRPYVVDMSNTQYAIASPLVYGRHIRPA